MVIFWTDAVFWSVVLTVIGLLSISLKSAQNRRMLRNVFESPIAMSSAVVLVLYFSIAALDSIHFERTDGFQIAETNASVPQVISVLDRFFLHLIQSQERTYSAPFATQEFSRSVRYNAKGQTEQVYLPLKYGGQHLSLKGTENKTKDILQKTLLAFVYASLMVISLILIHLFWRRRRRAFLRSDNQAQVSLPWWSAYLTMALLVGLLVWAYYLSHYYHVLGTDKVGQDVLYQSLKSIRTGVLIGVLTTLVMLPLALVLGISAGYFKGWVDDTVQYIYTTLNSIPGVLLIAAAVLVMQVMIYNHPNWFESTEERADLRLLFLILILGVTSWTGLCRLLRAETLKISQIEFVTAARAFGLSHPAILVRHILPNLFHLVLIAVVLDFSALVLAEAVLSYVGIGVDPTMYSWGNMINQARLEMAREPVVWWSLLSAFLFMFLLVLAANLFSDRVQWVLDPRANTGRA